jgi:hypothetical protein
MDYTLIHYDVNAWEVRGLCGRGGDAGGCCIAYVGMGFVKQHVIDC